jgi:hypothetical protein
MHKMHMRHILTSYLHSRSMKLVDEKRLRDEQHGAQETESIKIDNDLKKSDDDV